MASCRPYFAGFIFLFSVSWAFTAVAEKKINQQIKIHYGSICNGFLYTSQDLTKYKSNFGAGLLGVDLTTNLLPLEVCHFTEGSGSLFPIRRIGVKHISDILLRSLPIDGRGVVFGPTHTYTVTWSYSDLEMAREIALKNENKRTNKNKLLLIDASDAKYDRVKGENNPLTAMYDIYVANGKKDPVFYHDHFITFGGKHAFIILADHSFQAGAQKKYFLPVEDIVPDESIPAVPIIGLWEKVGEIRKDNPPPVKEESSVWVMTQKIIPAFNEPFRVFVGNELKGAQDRHMELKEKFYFLTQSGQVFVSPFSKKVRKMEALWKDPDQPIVGIITDADKEKHYLFGRAQDKDPAKRHFFIDLFDRRDPIEPHYYDPKKLPLIEAPEPLRTLLEFSQVLVAEKLIKLPRK